MRCKHDANRFADAVFRHLRHAVLYKWMGMLKPLITNELRILARGHAVQRFLQCGDLLVRIGAQRKHSPYDRLISADQLLELFRSWGMATPDMRIIRFDLVQTLRRAVRHHQHSDFRFHDSSSPLVDN
ncbi:hypothetical protein D3C74_273070 [compost metagenome]